MKIDRDASAIRIGKCWHKGKPKHEGLVGLLAVSKKGMPYLVRPDRKPVCLAQHDIVVTAL